MTQLLRRTMVRVFPLSLLMVLGGCVGITGMQAQDFAWSTGIRVVVQTLVSILQAALTGSSQ